MGEIRMNEGCSLRIAIPKGFPEEIQRVAREITELFTLPDKRNQGFARKLLESVCEEADKSGLSLLLECKPDEDDTESERLQKFYAKFGFAVFQREPLLMCRVKNA